MSAQAVCDTSELAPGTTRVADLVTGAGSTVTIALIRTEDGEFYAIDDECSHGQVSLAEGELTGCEIECWAHGARFDVRTGEPTALPALSPVNAYAVSFDGTTVLVDVDHPKTSIKENA